MLPQWRREILVIMEDLKKRVIHVSIHLRAEYANVVAREMGTGAGFGSTDPAAADAELQAH
ncbi:hypothetical protein AB0L13_38795 [Saccharopolyspora shandongensis]|uniref:hypothetical protein n=1 Tax=Saccharopolyspora shandongensis TaxID=418495 RepID=UPI0034169E21